MIDSVRSIARIGPTGRMIDGFYIRDLPGRREGCPFGATQLGCCHTRSLKQTHL